MTQEELSARFKGSPIKRTKRRGLLRNVAVALGNWGAPEAVPALAIALNDEEPLIRGHAAWALGASAPRRRGRRCGGGKRWRRTRGCGRRSRRRWTRRADDRSADHEAHREQRPGKNNVMSDEPSSFADAIGHIASELRGGRDTHGAVNRASGAIDHLGRRLHGMGYFRGREIAECFTAALAELETSHALPDEERREPVNRAADRLESAVVHAGAGVSPDPRA